MPLNRRFRSVTRIGPVQVGTANDDRGREKHTAACTAPPLRLLRRLRLTRRRRTGRPHPPLPHPLKESCPCP